MSVQDRRQYAILIVSTSEQFNIYSRDSIPTNQTSVIDIKRSASTARRALLEREYDIILVNAPLSDELGVDFAMDITDEYQSGVLIAVPSEIYDDVNGHLVDRGIIVISKPLNRREMTGYVRLLIAEQNKIMDMKQKLNAMEEKLSEFRVVNKAKWFLISEKGMTEDEAHRYIGKYAMDNSLTKKRAATYILDEG